MSDLASLVARVARLESALIAATVDSTIASAILAHLLTVDGNDSGLNADTLDGLEGSAYATDAEVAASLVGYVAKSDYDANTILASDGDNSPTSRTIGEQTVVGRLTGQAIKALNTTELTGLVDAASDTAAGKVELATDAEVATGTDTARAVTPAAGKAGYVMKAGDTMTGQLVIPTGSSDAKGLTILPSTNAGHERATAIFGGWEFGQDLGESGDEDFFWYNDGLKLYMSSAGVLSRDNTADDYYHYGARAVLGSQYTNSANPKAFSNITGLSFSLYNGLAYHFKFYLCFQSAATGTGIGFTFTGPTVAMVSWHAQIAQGAAGTDMWFESWGSNVTDIVESGSVQAANVNYPATIEGIILPTADGTLQLRARSENDGTQVTIQAGSCGLLHRVQ